MFPNILRNAVVNSLAAMAITLAASATLTAQESVIEGILVAVDTNAYAVTVESNEYQTRYSLLRKAVLRVAERDITLQDLKLGQNVKLIYDAKAKFVTALAVTGNATVKASSIRGEYSAIVIETKGNGEGKLSYEPWPETLGDNARTSIGVNSFPLYGGEATPLADGRYKLVFDFANIQDMQSIKRPAMDDFSLKKFEYLRLDRQNKSLVLDAKAASGARFEVPSLFIRDFQCKVIVRSSVKESFKVVINSGMSRLLLDCAVGGSKDPAGFPVCGLYSLDQKDPTLLSQLVITSAGRTSTGFAIEPEFCKNRMLLSIQNVDSPQPVAVRAIEITSRFPPIFGMKLKGADFSEVEAVFPGTPAERAGIKVGDRLITINDTAVSSTTPALELLNASPLESETVIEFNRNGRRMQVRVNLTK